MTPRRHGEDRPIDWDEVRTRLGRAATGPEEARLSPEQAKLVLDARALALARVPERAPEAAEVLELATFLLADERYAVETRYVRRVARLDEPTTVPGAPEVLAGVVNSGGEILAVFDLRLLFGLAATGRPDQARMIVLGEEREEFGILADSAHEILTLRLDDLFDPPDSLEGAGRLVLRGVTADALVVLDGAALLRDERLIIHQGEDPGA